MTKKNTHAIMRTLITALISLGVTVYFISICLGGLNQKFIEDGWEAARGTILSPEATLSGRMNVQRKNQGIEQVLNYEYEVAGVKYQSNSVAREELVDLENYPEGKIVDVYYNPKKPFDSILVRTKVQKHYLYATIAACFLVFFIISFCFVRDLKALTK